MVTEVLEGPHTRRRRPRHGRRSAAVLLALGLIVAGCGTRRSHDELMLAQDAGATTSIVQDGASAGPSATDGTAEPGPGTATDGTGGATTGGPTVTVAGPTA